MAGKSKKNNSTQKPQQIGQYDKNSQIIWKYKEIFVKAISERHHNITGAIEQLDQDPKNFVKAKNLLSCACQVIYHVFDNRLININLGNHAKQIYRYANALINMLIAQYNNAEIMTKTIEMASQSHYSSKHKVSALIVNQKLTQMITIRLAYNQDRLSFIKGSIEKDELPMEALIREIKEETNIIVSEENVKSFVSFSYKDDIIRQYLVVLDEDDINKYARDGKFNKYEIKSVHVMNIQNLYSVEQMQKFIHIYQLNANQLINLVNQWRS